MLRGIPMIESLVAERKQSKETTKSEGKVLEEEGADSDLNKDDSDINKGVELLLRNRRRSNQPKTFQVKFSFFNREIAFCLDIKKK